MGISINFLKKGTMVATVFTFLVAFSASCSAFLPSLTVPHTTRPNVCTSSQQRSLNALSMKLFDWKRREDPNEDGQLPVGYGLADLKPAPGSRKPKTRKGRGIAAGQGASCGFGMRGQKSRSGRSVRPGFEGGQMPLYRRVPKSKHFQIINQKSFSPM